MDKPAKGSYRAKLLDPRWQRKRLEILERDGWECQDCGDEKTTLHVHHTYYERGREPWEYENESLLTLCAPCHDGVTAASKRLEKMLRSLGRHGTKSMLDEIIGFIVGNTSRWKDPDPEEEIELSSYAQVDGCLRARRMNNRREEEFLLGLADQMGGKIPASAIDDAEIIAAHAWCSEHAGKVVTPQHKRNPAADEPPGLVS